MTGSYLERIEKAWAEHEQRQREDQEAAFQAVEEAQEKLKAELVASNGVERIVKQGRVPLFENAFVGSSEMREVVFCHVPPVGTQLGDTMIRVTGGAYLFRSPKGVDRGIAETLEFTPQEAQPLQARIEALRPLR